MNKQMTRMSTSAERRPAGQAQTRDSCTAQVSAAQRAMVAAIAKAQRDKVISDRLKPQDLFGVITALTRMGTPEFTRLNPPSSTAAARTALHDIVQQLVQP